MKKLFLLITMTILPLMASAFTGEVTIDGIKYFIKTSGKYAEVRGYTSECPSNLVIPASVEYEGVNCNVILIADYAFQKSINLTSITIPNSVTSIGMGGFSLCSNLTSVTIGNGLKNIGEYAFSSCSSLTSITIPNSVTSIGDFAFSGCTSLTSVTIPNSVTSIGSLAFTFCSNISSVIVESSNAVYDSRDNCNAIIETSTDKLISGCKNTIIPNSVTNIGEYNQEIKGVTNVEIVPVSA